MCRVSGGAGEDDALMTMHVALSTDVGFSGKNFEIIPYSGGINSLFSLYINEQI